MTRSTRVRRPSLERTKPIRNWTTTVISPDPPRASAGPEVQNANRVVEEYLRAGEANARLFQNALGGGATNGGPDITQAMVRAASDMMSFWMELMTRSVGAMSATAAAPPANAQAGASRSEPSARLCVSVAVDSRQPAKVSIDLRPDAKGATLRLERLHRRGSGRKAILDGAAIEAAPGDDVVIVRLHVAADQPPGVYYGVIVNDESSLPVGTLTIELEGGRAAARAKSRR